MIVGPPHYLTLPGLVFALVAVYRMSGVDWHTSFESLAVSMALLSVGMAAFPPPTLSRAIASLPAHLIGYGSGAINFALQLGGAFGTAALVTLMDQRTLFHSDHLTAGLTAGNSTAMHAMAQLQSAFAQVGTAPFYQQAAAARVLGQMDQTWAQIFCLPGRIPGDCGRADPGGGAIVPAQSLVGSSLTGRQLRSP
ncbi:MAG: hypothetical protein MH219_10965 [Marinobacter sp.]|nr:hypothetical protein [Marinobacter sp.]